MRKSLTRSNITLVLIVVGTMITTFVVYAAFIEPLSSPTASDQDFTENILGSNDANNDFNSGAVVPDVDGSVVERLEYIQSQLN